MNALKISNNDSLRKNVVNHAFFGGNSIRISNYLLVAILILIWPIAQYALTSMDATIGFIDPNIWLLFFLSLICFMVLTGLCWWFLQRFWMSLGLPAIGDMVVQFKELCVWQQLGFYWASFVSLLLAAVGVLGAIL